MLRQAAASAAGVDRREAEADMTLGFGLVGAAKDLAVGEILAPVGVDPAAPSGVICQVGVRRNQANNLLGAEEVGDALLLIVNRDPSRDWVVGAELAGGVDEIFVVGQRHIGVLRGGFLSVADDQVSILAAGAQLGEEVDTTAARQEIDSGVAEAGEDTPAVRYARARLRAAGQV